MLRTTAIKMLFSNHDFIYQTKKTPSAVKAVWSINILVNTVYQLSERKFQRFSIALKEVKFTCLGLFPLIIVWKLKQQHHSR